MKVRISPEVGDKVTLLEVTDERRRIFRQVSVVSVINDQEFVVRGRDGSLRDARTIEVVGFAGTGPRPSQVGGVA